MLKKKALLPVLLALILLAPGCIGSFALSHEVWQRNSKIESPAGRELLFLGLLIVPVYEVAVVADLLLFNTVELFSGEKLWDTRDTQGTTTDIEP